MSNDKGAVAAQDVVYTQVNDKGEAVMTASQEGRKLTLVVDTGCQALGLSSSGKSVLLGTGSFEIETEAHGKIRVQCNVTKRLKTSADVARYEAIIIAGAERQAGSAPAETLENNSILQRAAAIKAGNG